MYIRYTYCTCIYVLYVCTVGSTPRGGGGGTLIIYWWGVPQHIQKEGVFKARTQPKKGSLRHVHESKRGGGGGGGVSRTGLVKKTILVTDVAQKGVLLITLTFSCQHDQLVDRLKKRGLRPGSGKKKRGLRHGSGKKGVLCTGQARKKGGLRHGSDKKEGSLLRHILVLTYM